MFKEFNQRVSSAHFVGIRLHLKRDGIRLMYMANQEATSTYVIFVGILHISIVMENNIQAFHMVELLSIFPKRVLNRFTRKPVIA